MVDAYEFYDDDVILEMEADALPEEMKGMDDEEKIAYIEEKKQLRIDIKKEINELNALREKYITENQNPDNPELLDKAIIKAVKKQAIAKNYVFKDD